MSNPVSKLLNSIRSRVNRLVFEKDVTKMENPYVELFKQRSLLKYRDQFEKLNEAQLRSLAKNAVLRCPQKELADLENYKEELNYHSPSRPEYSFYEAITQALTLRRAIESILDEKNPHPESLFLSPGFTETWTNIINSFDIKQSSYLSELMLGKEKDIATRLALATPEDESSSSTLMTNFKTINCPDFATTLGKALLLKHEIVTKLLGENPETFFSSPEFHADLCNEFPQLVHGLLIHADTGAIAEKLSNLPMPQLSDIGTKLNAIRGSTADSQNPFRLIQDSTSKLVEPKIEKAKADARIMKEPSAVNPHRFHTKIKERSEGEQPQATPSFNS